MRKILLFLPAVLVGLGATQAQMPAPSPVPVAVPATLPKIAEPAAAPAPVAEKPTPVAPVAQAEPPAAAEAPAPVQAAPAPVPAPTPVPAPAPVVRPVVQAPAPVSQPLPAATQPAPPPVMAQPAPVAPAALSPRPMAAPATMRTAAPVAAQQPAYPVAQPTYGVPAAPMPAPFQQQAPAMAPAVAQPAAAPKPADDGYVIGPDDMIEVSVLGAPDFTTRARVRTDGTIPVPYLGTIEVKGHTSLSLGQMLTQRLRSAGIYANPILNVEIVSFASRYVILLGEVASPGLQPVDRAYRVSEIIARAGGLRESGADFVIVTRANGTEMKLPFEKLATGSDRDDPLVTPGDKIFVPKAQTYYIYGQINAPGVYPIKGSDMTLRKAIATGGGLGPMGSERRIKVYHDGREKKMTMDEIVQPGDVIVVGERLF